MPQTISIVGTSESGKTTLLEKLIYELKNRGYKTGVIKHVPHGLDIDKKGKDTYRLKASGADTVMAGAPGQIALIKDVSDDSLEALEKYFTDMDIILTEGYKRESRPKIEIFRDREDKKPLFLNDRNLIALVTDTHINVKTPVFRTDQIHEIADLISMRINNDNDTER
jgi:molybdopterin-guanine dinucleotide biosynthesis adapter protein